MPAPSPSCETHGLSIFSGGNSLDSANQEAGGVQADEEASVVNAGSED